MTDWVGLFAAVPADDEGGPGVPLAGNGAATGGGSWLPIWLLLLLAAPLAGLGAAADDDGDLAAGLDVMDPAACVAVPLVVHTGRPPA